jgi:hypothetical protein
MVQIHPEIGIKDIVHNKKFKGFNIVALLFLTELTTISILIIYDILNPINYIIKTYNYQFRFIIETYLYYLSLCNDSYYYTCYSDYVEQISNPIYTISSYISKYNIEYNYLIVSIIILFNFTIYYIIYKLIINLYRLKKLINITSI